MRTEEAVRVLNGMVFKPGWTVHATAYLFDLVLIELRIETVDTSYPDRNGNCHQRITLLRDTVIDASQVDDIEGLCYAVLKLAADTDQHENREFLKVRRPDGSWYAPMHPHTPAGEAAWDEHNRGRVRA